MLSIFFNKLVQISSATMPINAVRVGRNLAVNQTWNECKAEVGSFPKARYKRYNSEADAEAFVAGLDQLGKKALRGPAHKGAQPSREFASQSDKPYGRSFSTSARKSKGSKKTRVLDREEFKKLAKETVPAEDGSLGVVVHTDGACCFNGMQGAQAGIGVYWGPNNPWNVSERLKAELKPTNNRAEIYAVVKAIEQAKERGIKELNVHTDSRFLIDSVTKWIYAWKKNGWKSSTGAPVINKEDFLVLEKASKGVTVNYTHVKGHDGVPGNEAADKLAVAGTKKKHEE